jgi:AbrB family looped-hinge helix DNA binding protein
MTITIDAAGRVVIPKELRDEAHLVPGVPLEIRCRDGRIEIEPAPRTVQIARRGRLHVAVPAGSSSPLRASTVKRTRDRLREG